MDIKITANLEIISYTQEYQIEFLYLVTKHKESTLSLTVMRCCSCLTKVCYPTKLLLSESSNLDLSYPYRFNWGKAVVATEKIGLRSSTPFRVLK